MMIIIGVGGLLHTCALFSGDRLNANLNTFETTFRGPVTGNVVFLLSVIMFTDKCLRAN